jgi:Phage tail tube protein
MPLGITNRVALRLKPEATFGVTPSTGNHYLLRLTGETLKYALQTTQSNEIRSDRMITDLPPVGAGAEGDINFEFSYGEFDSLLASALQGIWAASGTNGVTTGTVTTTTTSLTVTGAGTPFSTVVAGQWFRLANNVSTGNNGWWQAVSATSTSINVASGLTASTTTGTGLVQTARLTNGTSQSSFSIERNNADLTLFSNFRGMTPARLSLNLTPGQILTGSMSFTGKDAQATVGTTNMPGTSVASATNGVYNSVSNVFNVLEGGAALTNTYVRSLQVSVDNNLRGQTAIGTLGNIGIGAGQSVVTGTMELYFADATYFNKFVNNTASSLSVRVSSSSTGIGYVLTFPNIKYSDGGTPTPGANQDVSLSLPFQALRDTTTGYQILIDRGGDAVTAWAS